MTHDIRNELSIEEHSARCAAPVVNPNAPIQIRFMRVDEATALARCVYRSYGDSYDADWVYQPDLIADKIEQGILRSIIGLATDGEIVGHAGMNFATPNARVAESGQAVVDPRYRGHHIFTSLKRYMADWATREGMYGIYSEATALHPYSQKANLELGAHETGILLGYIPASVHYKDIQNAESQRRQSVTLFYLKTNDGPERSVYAPARHHEVIAKILATSGIHGELKDSLPLKLAATTKLALHLREKHKQAVISVTRFGTDFMARIADQLNQFCKQHRECIYVDLPLTNPATAHLGEECEKLGFFFGGIFPHMLGNGDVLRLQYLNKVDVHVEDIKLASAFGQQLLDYIRQR